MNEVIVSMNNISKSFPGVKALDHVKFELRSGEVMALLGENGAGKSTLMKILSGVYTRDEGTMEIFGKSYDDLTPKQAQEAGVAIIHQELNMCKHLTVTENMFLGREVKGGLSLNNAKMRKEAKRVLDDLRIDISPDQIVGDLPVSKQQMVEIAKALSINARILIMDEPTSSLTAKEIDDLFRIIRKLRDEGRGIVYISHRLEELSHIVDRVTIMRDGQYIGTWAAKDLNIDFIITKMVGRELTNLYPKRENKPGEVIFEVEDFTSINPKSFRNVSFNVRKGEILGVAGLVGAQRTELMEGLFGLRRHQKGHVRYAGQEININQPTDAIKRGIAMLTEDRRATGILGVLSIADNVSIASLDKYLIGGILLDDKKIEKLVQNNVAKLSIKTPSSKTLIQSLSGGNQQKVLISRWLANDPDVFILDEPTRGIDVGAKYEIYCIIEELARQGKSIIMISSEMGELIGMSDRIMVMCDGRVTGFIDGDKANQENIMELATQFE